MSMVGKRPTTESQNVRNGFLFLKYTVDQIKKKLGQPQSLAVSMTMIKPQAEFDEKKKKKKERVAHPRPEI